MWDIIDANRKAYLEPRAGIWISVLLAFLVAGYREGNLLAAVVLLGSAILILAQRHLRRLEALEAEIAALRAQLAAVSPPGRN